MALCASWLAGCSSCRNEQPPADWVASIASTAGTVRVRLDAKGALVAAKAGVYLRVGARLETGNDGEAHLALRNGGKLTIRPNSVVTLRSSAPEKKLALELAQGTVVGKASKIEAADLVIGVGKRKVRLARQATATVAAKKGAAPRVLVEYGKATVEGPSGATTIVAGKPMTLGPPRKPDARATKPDTGPGDASPSDAIQAAPLVFYLKSTGRGRVLVRQPGEKRFRPVGRGKTIEIRPGTELRLLRRARVVVGPEKGKGTSVSGPARLRVEEGPPLKAGAAPSVRLATTGGGLQIRRTGKPGTRGSAFVVEGVRLRTRVRHRRLDVRVRRERGRAIVVVGAGSVTLIGKNGKVELEGGQSARLAGGVIAKLPSGRRGVLIRKAGTLRVFVPKPRVAVTLRWDRPDGSKDALVEVARNGNMRNPIFSDRISRKSLTLANIPRGVLYWRVRPVSPEGAVGEATKGRVLMIRDTSYRVIKWRTPRNTINLSDKDTVVFYQNRVPRFTFRWAPTRGATRYRLRIMRESNVGRAIVDRRVRRPQARLRTGRLGEGSYLWYVSALGAGNQILDASKAQRLSVRYDNATPDLQIRFPRDGLRVSTAAIEVKGVTMPGSQVFVNGAAATLDKTYRFTHRVALKPGENVIRFKVVDKRRGSSIYLRHVTRR
ncbi:MAG: FecR domain-containing protein [Myxococcales bacterium]|nr:FecR domain-containing protein [Myxococcales bacterium]